ncbi:MAG: hypothetical protein MJ078_05045 [Clostridia bacterium]|nr:hypothetical protein [Clostridia bacterium]
MKKGGIFRGAKGVFEEAEGKPTGNRLAEKGREIQKDLAFVREIWYDRRGKKAGVTESPRKITQTVKIAKATQITRIAQTTKSYKP